MEGLPEGKKIILFDGICNLCDHTVQYIIRKDKKDIFRFVPLESPLGVKIRQHIGISNRPPDSIVLYEPGHAWYIKSAAVAEIGKTLGGTASLAILLRYLPWGIADALYRYVANNRYKWYGRKEACMMPTDELKSKFL